MRTIRVKVTAAHIASVAAAGYGPKIIAAALHDRLIDGVYIYVRCCWLMLGGRGGRIHIHLPLNLLPYTDRFSREKLLQEMTFTITLPRELVRGRPRAPRAPRP